MDGGGGPYVKSNEPKTERQVSHDFIHMGFHRSKIYNCGYQRLQSEVGRKELRKVD